MATIKDFYVQTKTGAGTLNIPENNGFMVKHNSGGTGTVTVTNTSNGNAFTVQAGQVISLNFEFTMTAFDVAVVGAGSTVEVIYFK